MVRLAASSMFFHEYPLDELFDMVAGAGLDTLEFWVETPHFWTRGQPVAELEACISRHSRMAPLSVHAPILDLNPCSINPRVALASVEYAQASITLADRIGAGIVTVHPGRRTAKRPPSGPDFRRFDHYLSVLCDRARGAEAMIAIENMEEKVNSLLCTPDAVRDLLDREPWLSFTLDVSHAMATSLETVGAYIELCSDRLAMVHLSLAQDGTLHLPVDASPGIATILGWLSDAGFDGIISFEIEDMTFDHDLSSEEKVLLLSRQASFVRGCLE